MKSLRFFWRRSDADRLLEMQAHRQMAQDDYLERGVTPEEARRRAAADAGSSTAALETVREQDFLGRLELLLRDFCGGGQKFKKNSGLFRDGSADTGAGHWREHCHLQLSLRSCSEESSDL
jgi:hypothetical protein